MPSDPLTVAVWLASRLLDRRDAYTIDDNDDITRDKSLCGVLFLSVNAKVALGL